MRKERERKIRASITRSARKLKSADMKQDHVAGSAFRLPE